MDKTKKEILFTLKNKGFTHISKEMYAHWLTGYKVNGNKILKVKGYFFEGIDIEYLFREYRVPTLIDEILKGETNEN